MHLRQFRFVSLVLAVWGLALARPACGQTGNPVELASVTRLPAGTLTPSTSISLDAFLTSGSAPIQLYQPTQVQVLGTQVNVDIFAESGLLAILDQRHEIASVGMLPAGFYNYRVTQNGPHFGNPTINGSFQVVPEPSTIWLLCTMCLAPLRLRRRS
jgi:hypothetical protein